MPDLPHPSSGPRCQGRRDGTPLRPHSSCAISASGGGGGAPGYSRCPTNSGPAPPTSQPSSPSSWRSSRGGIGGLSEEAAELERGPAGLPCSVDERRHCGSRGGLRARPLKWAPSCSQSTLSGLWGTIVRVPSGPAPLWLPGCGSARSPGRGRHHPALPSSLSHCPHSVLGAIVWSVPLAFPFISLMPERRLPGSSPALGSGRRGRPSRNGSRPHFALTRHLGPARKPGCGLAKSSGPFPLQHLARTLPPSLHAASSAPAHAGPVQAWAPCVLGTLRSGRPPVAAFEDARA